MVVFAPSVFSRILLAGIVFSYICLLALNLVSFAGIAWITYVDYNIQFGLWSFCYGSTSASATSTCAQWNNGLSIADAANNIVFSGKPGFIQAAQGLEIVSLIFYVLAGVLIIMGIIDLDRASFEFMFGGAAILLFLCMAFLSAALGVMGSQGRSNDSGATLSWAWWNGLAGLIMTTICVILLISFILCIIKYYRSEADQWTHFYQQQAWNSNPMMFRSGSPMMMTGGISPWVPQYSPHNQWYPGYYGQQFDPYNNYQNPFFAYGGYNQQQLSPVFSPFAQQNPFNTAMWQYQQQFSYPYGQYFVNSYF